MSIDLTVGSQKSEVGGLNVWFVPKEEIIFKHSNFHIIVMLFCFMFHVTCLMSQQVSAGFFFDSTHIQIGDHLGVKFSVKQQEGAQVQFPVFKDTLGDFEIIEVQKKDTAKVGSETLFTQRIIVSAYDSGLYSILPQKIYFTQNGLLDSLYTDVQFVEVTTLPVDTTKPIKPIKPPLDVKWKLSDFLPYILGGLIAILLLILGWWIYKKYFSKKEETAQKEKPKEPAHVWAMKELQKLEQEKLWQKEDAKTYYTRLTDIMRLYLEYRYDMLAMESTTDEIRAMILRDDIPAEAQQKFLSVLQLADLVKFAKMTPLPDEHHKCLIHAREFVKSTTPVTESVGNGKNGK